ncbi:MAG: hypothetical protein OEW67_04320 [Cyclobacteriaceae bacterium]|nr:hypothetical protein [Cyclobacteriaceae bacterium]
MLNQAQEQILLDHLPEESYDSIVKTGDFDFFNLMPLGNDYNSQYFRTCYKDKVLKKVTFNSSVNHFENYSLYLFPTNGFTYGVAIVPNEEPSDVKDDYLVNGLFIRINGTGYFYYLRMKQDVDFSKLLVEDIRTIMALDDKLFPISKINTYNNEPLTFSKFVYSNDILYERLQVITKTNSLYGNKSLAQYTLSEILDLIQGDGFMVQVNVLAKPFYPIEGKPIWSYSISKYQTSLD